MYLFYIVNRVVSGEIYTAGKKVYTAAGSDGIDKSHFWTNAQLHTTGAKWLNENKRKNDNNDKQ